MPRSADAALCLYCGEEEVLDVLEYYEDEMAFTLDTCCEALHNEAVEAIPLMSRKDRVVWFHESTGIRLRQLIVAGESPQWTADPGLTLCDVAWDEAKAFIAAHHRHSKPPVGWKYGKGLRCGDELVAVMTAGRPVARNLDPAVYVEVTRLCVKELYPSELGWNACSMLYGYACREASRRRYQYVITYTKLSEPGTSLLAAGFVQQGITRAETWDRRGRRRPNAPVPSPKKRWIRTVNPALPQMSQQKRLVFG